ncbi:DUF3311 domain-containing protein [Aquamicrobium terrae]|uniref:DUF3311 domain-containing protein n=1 Tax=Aquamicrobium terrae TaxID=1324945 RepID=A0ABV2MVH8_9HYPH
MSKLPTMLIGMGVPILLIVIVPPFLNDPNLTWQGIPVLLLWMFLCIPATALCLIVCWYCFDRQHYVGAEEDQP